MLVFQYIRINLDFYFIDCRFQNQFSILLFRIQTSAANYMYSFRCKRQNFKIMRAYALKHCYEESRIFEKSKAQNMSALSNCIIIRKEKIKNETDFGYKEELKTNILKKMNFVYLQSLEDLIAFLWSHCQQKQLLFGVLFIENIENYFGDNFDFKECGNSFLIVMKILRMILTKIKIKGRVAISYSYNDKICKINHFQRFLESEDVVDWEVCEDKIQKNGDLFESEQTKQFFSLYGPPIAIKILE